MSWDLRRTEPCLYQIEPAGSKVKEILEINVLQKFNPHALFNNMKSPMLELSGTGNRTENLYLVNFMAVLLQVVFSSFVQFFKILSYKNADTSKVIGKSPVFLQAVRLIVSISAGYQVSSQRVLRGIKLKVT